MSTDKEYLNFILEQLSDLEDITYIKMMGEYIIYFRGKIIAYICDNRFLVKPVETAKKLLPNAIMEPPYDGAKDMILVD
ncbi:MAG: TfoX/Sxy family protein, partial [Alphaproteobacteria bacterium]|nr:TfoX/Sxy family protein [Alphaproteobacteria bacterium]